VRLLFTTALTYTFLFQRVERGRALKSLERKERREAAGGKRKRPDRKTRQKQRMKRLAKSMPGHEMAMLNATSNRLNSTLAKRGTNRTHGGNATDAHKPANIGVNQGTSNGAAGSGATKSGGQGPSHNVGRVHDHVADSADEVVLYDARGNPLPKGPSKVLGMPGTEQKKQMTEMEALQDYCKGAMLEPIIDEEGNIKWVDRRTEDEQDKAEKIAEAREAAIDRGLFIDSSEDPETVIVRAKQGAALPGPLPPPPHHHAADSLQRLGQDQGVSHHNASLPGVKTTGFGREIGAGNVMDTVDLAGALLDSLSQHACHV
jgi:hypothetical protein